MYRVIGRYRARANEPLCKSGDFPVNWPKPHGSRNERHTIIMIINRRQERFEINVFFFFFNYFSHNTYVQAKRPGSSPEIEKKNGLGKTSFSRVGFERKSE